MRDISKFEFELTQPGLRGLRIGAPLRIKLFSAAQPFIVYTRRVGIKRIIALVVDGND